MRDPAPVPEDSENPQTETYTVPGDVQLAFVRRFGYPKDQMTDEQVHWLDQQLRERGIIT